MKLPKLSKEQWLGIVRHVITFGGGLLVAKGVIDEATLTEVSGAILTILGSIWSVSAKKQA